MQRKEVLKMLIYKDGGKIIVIDIDLFVNMIKQQTPFNQIKVSLNITDEDVVNILDSLVNSYHEIQSQRFEN